MLQTATSVPTSEETDSRVSQLKSKVLSTSTSADDEKDLEYDPSEDAVAQEQVEQDKADDDVFDGDVKEEVESESESSCDPQDEESLIRSESFAKELSAAIEHVCGIAKVHREEMIESIKEHLLEQTGLEVTDEAVSAAMKSFGVAEDMELVDGTTSGEEEDEEEVDEDLLDREMAEALEAVRELGQLHQPSFVDRVCDIYGELNDEEPTTETLYSLFRGIRVQFAEEAVSMDTESDVDSDEVSAETLAAEMVLGLEQVRKQAQLDQVGLIDSICDYYCDLLGYEPSVDVLGDILVRMKEQFGEEAREEFLEINQDEDDEEDSDYEVDEDSAAEQYAEDETEDIYISEEHLVSDSDLDEAEYLTSSSIDDDVRFLDLAEIEDEEELVNDPVFGELFCSAIEHIQSIGREDGVSMVLDIVEQYEEETGQRVTEEMVEVAVAVISSGTVTESVESEAESEDEEELAIEMQEAVDRARELGALHREQLVNRICDLYAEENGEEMSVQKLYAIFGDIEQGLAEEDEEDEADSGDLDGDSFAAEFESAIDHIQMVAKQDQEEMVDALCDIYCDYNGEEPSTPELYEMFADIKASFVEEAAEDLIENALEEIDDDDEEQSDSDYSPDSDAYDYSVDAVDDVLYHDSEYDEEDSSDSDYDSDYEPDKEEEDELALYQQDAVEDEDADLTDTDTDADAEEQKASELEESGSDSAYSPEKDAFDYFEDYEADQVYSTTSESTATDTEFETKSEADSDSESEEQSDSDSDSDYDPNYDLTDYLMDYEPFQKVEAEESESEEDDSDYSVEKDEYDYTQDVEDDLADTSEATEASEDEQDVVVDEVAA